MHTYLTLDANISVNGVPTSDFPRAALLSPLFLHGGTNVRSFIVKTLTMGPLFPHDFYVNCFLHNKMLRSSSNLKEAYSMHTYATSDGGINVIPTDTFVGVSFFFPLFFHGHTNMRSFVLAALIVGGVIAPSFFQDNCLLHHKSAM